MKIPPFITRAFNPSRFRESVIQNLSPDDWRMGYAKTHQARAGGSMKLASSELTTSATLFTPKTISDWNNALATATNPDDPSLQLLDELYDNLLLDAHTRSVIETRVMRVTRSKIKVVDQDGNENEDLTRLFERPWFADFARQVVMSQFTGVKVVEFNSLDEALELSKLVSIPLAHIAPKKGYILAEPGSDKGWSYRDGSLARYYMQIGDDNNIGELSRLAPLILAKKLGMGSWLNYVEKYAIEPRVAFTSNWTPQRQKELLESLLSIKSQDVAVMQEGERLESLKSGDRDAYQIYKELINMINDEITKGILGQAGTVDAKEKTGTYGSMQVMQEVSEDRHESDRMMLKDIVNKQLIPKLMGLSSLYSSLATHEVVWDDSEEMSVQQVGNLAVSLSQAGFILDTDELSEKTGLTITGYRDAQPRVVPGKNKPNAISAQIAAYYDAQGIGQMEAYTPEAASLKVWKDTILKIARQLHRGEIKVTDLSAEMISLIYEELEAAAVDGLGDDYDEDDDQVPNDKKATARKVKGNVYRFAAAKSYVENVELSNALLDDDGKLRSWNDYKKEVDKIHTTYNRNHLQAEFQTARRSGQAIRQWEEYQANADLFPNLEYRTVGDERVRDDHDAVDGVILPLDDPFWDRWYPPNGFRCRCGVRQTDKSVVKRKVSAQPDKGFSQNVGKSLEIYSEDHPAFASLPKEVSKDIDKKLKKRNDE